MISLGQFRFHPRVFDSYGSLEVELIPFQMCCFPGAKGVYLGGTERWDRQEDNILAQPVHLVGSDKHCPFQCLHIFQRLVYQ